MDGFVIIDRYNGQYYVYDSTSLKKGEVINKAELDELVTQNNNKAFVLPFVTDDWEQSFREKFGIPKQQIWDWKSLVWGEPEDLNRKLRISVYHSPNDTKHFSHGKSSLRGMFIEKEIIIGKKISGVECYTMDHFFDLLMDAAKKRLFAARVAESYHQIKGSQMPPAMDLSPIETQLSDISMKLDKLLSDRQSASQAFAPSRPAAGSNDKTEKLLNYIISLLENAPAGGSSGNDGLVSELKTQLEEYKVDFYFKAMRKHGIDAMLDVVEYLYTCKDEADETEQAILQKILNRIERRTLKEKLNVRTVSSEPGVPFDAGRMISYSGDAIPTDDESKHNTVARSVRPAFYWTMPMVNGQGGEYLFKEEVVILYKYNHQEAL